MFLDSNYIVINVMWFQKNMAIIPCNTVSNWDFLQPVQAALKCYKKCVKMNVYYAFTT